MDAATFVADLLAACRNLVMIVTSREALGIRPEQVFPVEPLPVPSLERLADEQTARVASVALFEERARARRPTFRLTDANLPAVAEICIRLDGLPLAIELAAAQASAFSPQEILNRLSTRTPFHLKGPRDLPPRHQTLEAAVSWSYDLLDPEERAVFRWCGVFAGGYTAEAAEAARAEIGPRIDTVTILAQLVTKSLVRLAELDASMPRYSVLETLRAFCLAKLQTTGELDEARRRHATYYVELAERLQPQLRGEGMAEALGEVSREYANFREVFHWSSETGELSVGLRLAGALYRFWLVRGHLAEARQWLEPALSRASSVEPRIHAVALNAAGVLAGMQHDYEPATAFFERSLELWTGLSDRAQMAYSHLNIGLVAHNLGDLDRAQRQFRHAEQLFLEVGDEAGLGRALGSLARITHENGQLEQAVALFTECLVLFRRAHDEWGIANALQNLGHVKLALRNTVQAEDSFRQALDVRLGLGNVLGVAESLEGFAAAAVEQNPRRAVRLVAAADALRERAGAPVPAAEHDSYTELLARARLRQRDADFATAWAEGRAMSMDEAVALALRTGSLRKVELADDEPESDVLSLTPREREVAELVALGRSNREIATSLVVTVRTIETHLENAFRKLGVQSRAELAVWAVQHGLGPSPRS
jgi:non-specific serine/threonine protein kinase